ncbi:OLC1v1006284C1 [Oldenlandia corymbosa var. corymbosa]|uniref:OLC1v1006284C1 n=1 Tax=Oldenlandia corymbosa var. corymbosa TaxID=529605 RepID=A0AAV1DJ60_OLDCO|nr:OLC1v1006284C1 [Oldenlandia corymbosa var. corymbosa]
MGSNKGFLKERFLVEAEGGNREYEFGREIQFSKIGNDQEFLRPRPPPATKMGRWKAVAVRLQIMILWHTWTAVRKSAPSYPSMKHGVRAMWRRNFCLCSSVTNGS